MHCGEKVVRGRTKKKELSVPKPKQLSDGRWTAQLMVDGKRVSVYGATVKEYEAAARALKTGAMEMKVKNIKSLGAAIDAFLESNSNLLSPSTMRGFNSYRNNRFQDCMDWNIYDPDLDWQRAINSELEDVGAKTVRNAWGLITAAMSFHKAPHPSVKLPRKTKAERPWLDYKQIDIFLEAIKGEEFELAALMALHSMRLSELIAVKPENIDLKKDVIKIRGARVLNKDGGVVYKELNKTEASRREIPIVIPRLKELLTPEVMKREWVADYSEKRLYDKVNAVCVKCGLPKVGVHGLRHSFASLAYHLKWQKKSTQQVGGWTNSTIVDEVYSHNADLDSDIKKMKRYYAKKVK